MSKITVEHSTRFGYSAPVLLPPHTFRVHPRTTIGQHLISYRLDVNPEPARMAGWLDLDGNQVVSVWFAAPVSQFELQTRFAVQVASPESPSVPQTGQPHALPMSYRRPVTAALAPYRIQDNIGPAVRAFSAALIGNGVGHAASFLDALNREVFQSCRHIRPHEGPPWHSDLTLHLREGSASDLAMLFCDACRAMGIAARYVSGYDCSMPHKADDAMRAWAEAYLPESGWRGYDPSRGVAVNSTYIAVAAAAELELAVSVDGLYCGAPPTVRQERLRIKLGA